MIDFAARIHAATGAQLRGVDLRTLQVNVGRRCNLRCAHCHLACSPLRDETMGWPVMSAIVEVARSRQFGVIDITGGAPELNPDLRRFIGALREGGVSVQVRTNLTALALPGMELVPEFFRDARVALVGSLPCYLEEEVRVQRGAGVFETSIAVMRRLNSLGYGVAPELPLGLVYNPCGPFLPPAQAGLEADYRRELGTHFGVTFTSLRALANMPIGMFLAELRRDGKERAYRALLTESFNPRTIEGLMCRRQVSVDWDGTLYDCDFNLALGVPVDHGAPDHITRFSADALASRQIVSGRHCFGCTAGQGSSCEGALS
jgi:radical SAM/Cys-rich protein